MGATQFNHGQQALELVEAGLMLDLTDVAEANNWKEVVFRRRFWMPAPWTARSTAPR